MKHYVFGDTVKGFIDYLRSIWRMKADIKTYEYSRNEEYKTYKYEDYREAKIRYEQFKEFRQYSFRNCRFCSPQCAGLHRRKQK